MSALLALLALALPFTAQEQRFDPKQDVGIDQRLGESLPRELVFKDERGVEVRFGELLGERPVILAFVYYRCPMLCTLVLNGLVAALQAIDLDAGRDFRVIALSIDPRETPELAAEKRAHYLVSYRREGSESGWSFLTGDERAIRALADAAGFRYVYDASADEFAHASGVIVTTPEGELSHYFFGVEYSARDLRLALVEASQGEIGTAVDRFLLLCYHYDPATGRYGFAIINGVRAAGLLTVLALVLFIVRALRRERRQRRQPGSGALSA